MRICEIAIVGLLSTSAAWILINGSHGRSILWFFFGLDLAALVLHLTIEGAHWQMGPVYVGLLVLAALLLWTAGSARALNAGAYSIIVLVLLACILSAILPMFRLPRPTGPYAIGTQILSMTDQSREEDAAPGAGRKRELMVQIWYPAGESRNSYAPYRRPKETNLMSSYQGVLATHARLNAPVLMGQGPYPVLLYSPSWNGRRTLNTVLIEDLASHGFVIAGIDHPYNSEPVVFPDGRIVHSLAVRDMDFAVSSPQAVEAAAEKELEKQTTDTIFVLNELETMNGDRKNGFYGQLDTKNAGALGHSFGGAVAAQACYTDARIRAALDLDGSLFGEVQRNGLKKPFMFITEDLPQDEVGDVAKLSNAMRLTVFLDRNDESMFEKSDGVRIRLHGSTHFSFTDRALFSPIRSLSDRGDIPPRREDSIIRSYALAFFNKALKGKDSPLLEQEASPFREATFERSRGSSDY